MKKLMSLMIITMLLFTACTHMTPQGKQRASAMWAMDTWEILNSKATYLLASEDVPKEEKRIIDREILPLLNKMHPIIVDYTETIIAAQKAGVTPSVASQEAQIRKFIKDVQALFIKAGKEKTNE